MIAAFVNVPDWQCKTKYWGILEQVYVGGRVKYGNASVMCKATHTLNNGADGILSAVMS